MEHSFSLYTHLLSSCVWAFDDFYNIQLTKAYLGVSAINTFIQIINI